MRDRIWVIANVASGAGVAVAVGEGRDVGVAVAVTVGSGVSVARNGGVSSKLIGAEAAWDGAPHALNPISAAHKTNQIFQRSFVMSVIILHFAEIFRL